MILPWIYLISPCFNHDFNPSEEVIGSTITPCFTIFYQCFEWARWQNDCDVWPPHYSPISGLVGYPGCKYIFIFCRTITKKSKSDTSPICLLPVGESTKKKRFTKVICDPLWFSLTTSRQSKSLKLQHHLGFSAGYPQCFHTIFSMWKTAKKTECISIDHFPTGVKPMGFCTSLYPTRWCPRSIAKLVNITPITMVFVGDISISIHGLISPIYNWGAPPCSFIMLYPPVNIYNFTNSLWGNTTWSNYGYSHMENRNHSSFTKWTLNISSVFLWFRGISL